MKTVNDLINELSNLKASLRKLPVVIAAPNGLMFEPRVKPLLQKGETILLDKPKQMIITYE